MYTFLHVTNFEKKNYKKHWRIKKCNWCLNLHQILKYRYMVNWFQKMNLRLKQFQGEHPNNVAVCIIFRPQRCNYYHPQHLWHFTRKRPTHVSVGHQWITRRSASGGCNWEYGLLSAQTVLVHPMRMSCSMFYDSSFSALMRQVPKANMPVATLIQMWGARNHFMTTFMTQIRQPRIKVQTSGVVVGRYTDWVKQSQTCIKLFSISDNLSYVCHKHNLMHHWCLQILFKHNVCVDNDNLNELGNLIVHFTGRNR